MKKDQQNENQQLRQTAVSGSTYAIYYDYGGVKMWLSPSSKSDSEQPETCVSHPFKRLTFSENELSAKILDLTKKYPTNIWLYEVVK